MNVSRKIIFIGFQFIGRRHAMFSMLNYERGREGGREREREYNFNFKLIKFLFDFFNKQENNYS